MMTFESFPKIPRLSRECIVTEKIDGTNGSIWIEFYDNDPEKLPIDVLYLDKDINVCVRAGSRNRFLSLDTDNFGFARWVKDNADALVCGLGLGIHHGEWWGQGIQRNYGKNTKTFSLFNTSRWNRFNVPECCDVVPVLWSGNFDTVLIDTAMMNLKDNGSLASPGFMNPEGIVVYHTHARMFFKKSFENDSEGKG